MQKQPVGLDFFKEIRTPYGLCANSAGAVCYAVRKANVQKNCYESSLWILQNGVKRRLNAPKQFSGHWWLNSGTLLLATAGTRKDKHRAQLGLPFTSLETLDTAKGEKTQKLLGIYGDVEDVIPLPNGELLILASWSAKVEKALNKAGGDTDEAAKLLQSWASCNVITDAPIWQNGSGITAGVRHRLYKWCNKSLAPITDESTDIETMRLSSSGRYVLCAGKQYNGLVPAGDSIICIDLTVNTTQTLQNMLFKPHFMCASFAALPHDEYLIAGTNGRKHGINQNPTFYKLNANNGIVSVLNDDRTYSCWQSVATDICNPSEMRWFYRDGNVYFISTVGYTCQLLNINIISGLISQFVCDNSTILEACQAGDDIYITAMRAQNGAEVYRVLPNGKQQAVTSLNAHVQKNFALQVPTKLECKHPSGHTITGWVLPPAIMKAGQKIEAPTASCLSPPKAGINQQVSFEVTRVVPTPQKVPTVLAIHGGPKAVYGTVLFAEMQLLAARGFAVIYCNPRGSDGKGDEFADIRGSTPCKQVPAAGGDNPTNNTALLGAHYMHNTASCAYAEKGGEDVLLFLDEALKQFDYLDENRVAVCGGSYGGFLVNWLIGHTQRFGANINSSPHIPAEGGDMPQNCALIDANYSRTFFKAAISERSISNWASMALLSDIGHYFVPDQISADVWESPEAMWEASPLKYAKNVTTPTLFINSSDDYRCPLSEGIQMYTALKLHGVPTRLCLFNGENHELNRSGKPQNCIKRLQEIYKWLEEWV